MIHLVLSSNENYADGLLVTVASALKSLNPEAEITVHFLNGGISERTRERLDKICVTLHKNCSWNNIEINEGSFQGFKPGPGNSLMTYARFLMGTLLNGIDKVIYIDVDFLVLKDLQELWERDMQGKIAWACQDISIPFLDGETPLPVSENEKNWPYFNAGFLVIDLKKWRETSIEKKSLELGLMNQSGLCDQAILNYLFRGDVGFLEQDWNWQSRNVLLDGRVRIANYHFIWVKKPWMHFRTTINYRLWRYYYRAYAEGSMISLYRRIGAKKLLIGIREILLRSSPALLSLYFKMVEKKFGNSSSEYLGLRDYYQESITAYPIESEKKAFADFARSKKSFT
jgi:lipopolysaccharide biosynthesis glycosyltransferase